MGNKREKQNKWRALVDSNTPPPIVHHWRPENEKKLQRLKESEIDLNYTSLVRQK